MRPAFVAGKERKRKREKGKRKKEKGKKKEKKRKEKKEKKKKEEKTKNKKKTKKKKKKNKTKTKKKQKKNKKKTKKKPKKTDRRVRYEIGPVTASFHRSVPSLRYLTGPSEECVRAVTRLLGMWESSNQYVTQQAALMLLAADYTGGIAFATLFEETPIIGFHPQLTDLGELICGERQRR